MEDGEAARVAADPRAIALDEQARRLRVQRHGADGLTELVHDRRRELAHRRHAREVRERLLPLLHLLVLLAALGDVAHDADEALGVRGLVAYAPRRGGEPPLLPLLADDGELVGQHRRRRDSSSSSSPPGERSAEQQVDLLTRRRRIAPHAEQRCAVLAQPHLARADVERPEAEVGGGGRELQLLLVLAHRFGGAAALGDVDADAR